MVHNERPIGGEYRDLTHCMGGRPLFQTSQKHICSLAAVLRSRRLRNLQKAQFWQIHNITDATIFGNSHTQNTDLCVFYVLGLKEYIVGPIVSFRIVFLYYKDIILFSNHSNSLSELELFQILSEN